MPSRIEPGTLVEMLEISASEMANSPIYTFLEDGNDQTRSISYRQFRDDVRRMAQTLNSITTPGSRALIALPSGIDFIRAFFACIYSGVIAVPVYPLDTRTKRLSSKIICHLDKIALDCSAEIIIGSDSAFLEWQHEFSSSQTLKKLYKFPVGAISSGEGYSGFNADGNDIAFLQYTSGSTADPKGVMVSHQNLIHNLRSITKLTLGNQRNINIGSWLPMYHDLGLISCAIMAPYTNSHLIFMDPQRFIQRPVRWLKMIGRHKVHASGGPNFAYDLCVRAVPDHIKQELDLSSWKIAFNCSEPVRAHSIVNFQNAFADCGFSSTSFFPCYGLAEATVMVTGDLRNRPVKMTTNQLIDQSPIITLPKYADGLRVSSGRVPLGNEIIIVDSDKKAQLGDGEEGEIWVRGGNVALGYWGKTTLTTTTFKANLPGKEGNWLRTGDLGYLIEGELFVTGRIKDVIIVRGKQFYPSELEETVQALDRQLKNSAGIVFSTLANDHERMIVAQETTAPEKDWPHLSKAIWFSIAKKYGVSPSKILLLQSGEIPKTFNGKLRRRLLKVRFEAGQLKYLYSRTIDAQELEDNAFI